MWKGVFKSRLGKASLFQAPSKMWNGVFINARQSKSVPSTLKTLGCTVPTQINQVRVHMTAMDSTEFQKGKNMADKGNPVKVSPVDGSNEGISKLGEDLYRRPVSYQTQFTPLDAKISLEEKLLKLMEEFTKLEEELGKLEAMEADRPEAWGSERECGRKKMELLARVETLYNEAKSYEFSVQSGRESFLISSILPRFEFQLKKRPSCDTETTDLLGENPWDKIPENSDKFLELNQLREAYPKVSQIQGHLAEFWKLNSFPVQAEYHRQNDLLREWVGLGRKLVPLLKSMIREYPQDIEEVASRSPSPEAGKSFDVVELLSRFPGDLIRNDGDRSRVALNRDTFKGKYVLIYCFHVPVLPVHNSCFPFIVNLCNELYSTRDDFEMVIVARMNSLANDEEVFHHFFSGFPKSCLAVPFEDNQRRDYICKVLGLGLRHDDNSAGLLLNAEGIAEGIVLPHLLPPIYARYGAEGFPFTEDIIYKRDLEREHMIFEKEGNWLERVLRCNDSSPDIVNKFDPSGGPREELYISQFSNEHKNKHVGLYLCSEGEIIGDLIRMFEQCREKQLDFEVVVVYMPFAIITDPKILQLKIDSLLKKHNICDWWCLPFNNSVSLRFFHLTVCYEIPGTSAVSCNCDKLIMVGPDVNHLDIYGAIVMLCQGIDGYPFTVDAGIKQRENKLKRIALESLFVDGDVSVFRGNDSSDSREVRQLVKGKKNVILCIDSLYIPSYGSRDYKTLASIYNRTKAVEKEDFEMVFVGRPGLEVEDEDQQKVPCHEMPWYICPVSGTNSTKLEELMDLVGQPPNILIGFGEDGRVCFFQEILQVTGEAKDTGDPASQQFSLGDTLYRDVEHLLGYDEFLDHDMVEIFANPRVGGPR